MRTKVDVEFTGAVFSVHVHVGGHEIGITRGADDKWEGTDDLDIVGDTIRVDLRFVAPSFTDWELVVKFDDEEILNESGRSSVPRFTFSKLVTIPQ